MTQLENVGSIPTAATGGKMKEFFYRWFVAAPLVGLFILFDQSMCLIARMRFKTEEERKKFWEYYG